MSLQYKNGEEIREGDVVIWLNKMVNFINLIKPL